MAENYMTDKQRFNAEKSELRPETNLPSKYFNKGTGDLGLDRQIIEVSALEKELKGSLSILTGDKGTNDYMKPVEVPGGCMDRCPDKKIIGPITWAIFWLG